MKIKNAYKNYSRKFIFLNNSLERLKNKDIDWRSKLNI